tara:strand:- start:342304 stop:345333 length:3030 start_codon:yes stop_codon:yes gene_type:complete
VPDPVNSSGDTIDEPSTDDELSGIRSEISVETYSQDDSPATYRSLVNALPLSLLIKDLKGRRVFANDAYLQFRGLTLDQIVGKRDVDLFPAEMAEKFTQDDQHIIATGTSVRCTEETRGGQGQSCWIERIKSPVINRQGKVIGVQLVFWEVTENILATQQQARDRHLLNTLLSNIPDSIYFKDPDSRFIRVSDALARKFGMQSEEEVVGKTDADIFSEEHARAAREDELRVIETGEPLVDRVEKETWPDRDDTWAMSTKMPFQNESGKIIGTFGISRDVTELKRSQDALVEARDAADKANRAKSDFLANMSHEIRTPMNAIIGMSELLSQTELSQEQSDYISLVRESADSLLRLLNDILDFSKIEARKLELETIPFSLRDVVGKTGRTLSLRSAEKGLELACRVAPEIPDRLLGDPGRLRQILMNLIGNAIKFTDHGEVAVDVSIAEPRRRDADSRSHGVDSRSHGVDSRSRDAEPKPKAGRSENSQRLRVMFRVRDTGVGIPKEKQAAVLEAFTQADASTTRRYGGTGLGLAISKQLVELMNGELTLDSTLGKGTTFSFITELAVADDQQIDTKERAASLNDLPVLVVDDNSTNRRILEEIFTAWRLRPSIANDAASALRMYQQAHDDGNPFALVVLDCMMPEMDGFQLAEAIRDYDQSDQTVLIMLSSAQRPDDARRCKEIGIARFMTKPVIQSELLDTVLDVMSVSDASVMDSHPIFDDDTPPMRVLVAEDGLANQHVAVGMLQAAGHSAFVAVDGREAVQRWETENFDIILMDMHMPVMDGLEATEAIREREQATGGHVPIIAVTAAAMTEDAKACRDAGMDDYLTKPIAPAQLRELLAKYAPSKEMLAENQAAQSARRNRKSDAEILSVASRAKEAATQEHAAASCRSTDRPDPDVVDFQVAAARVPGGFDGARKLAEVFQDECQTIMESLRKSIPARDTKEVRRASHTLKGSANLFGAKRVFNAAQAIEQRAVNDEIDSTESLLPALETEVARLMECLKRFIG